MDKRRTQVIRENKNRIKNLIKREQKSSYKFLIFFMIIGVLNYVLWHDQFLGLDYKYNIVFVVLPMILGLFIYYQKNKNFNKSVMDTKPSGVMDIVLSNGFLILTGLFFAYISMVTIANPIFKLSMDLAVNDKPFVYKTYVVESTKRNDVGRRMHFFSTIFFLDETNNLQGYDVPVEAVTDSYEKRKITFKCQEGYWGYYKILDYKMENYW